jgi:DNA repair protein RadD
MTTLRPYQTDIANRFFAERAGGKRRIILVAPTGSGKTVIAGEIIRQVIADGGRVLVLAHRREIVAQTSHKLSDIGIDHGIILAGEPTDEEQRVQVASVQTLYIRAIRGSKIELPPADLIVVDECHHATAKTWRKIVDAYPDAALLGLTATPCRGDGRGLGGIFETLIECPQVQELIEQEFLVGTRVYAPTLPDLKGIRVQAGDWVEKQLADVMDQPKLVGDIVSHWHRLAEGRRTVVFATGVQHSIHIREEFRKSGVSCEHIDGKTPKEERDDILRMLACGAIDVVTNCMVLTEGWDMPEIGCCVLARPTRKMGLFRQMIGRVLRPAPGKPDAIVIDHSGAVHRHGFVEDAVVWTLDPDRHAENPAHASRSERDISSRLVDCTQCGALRTGGEPCRHCGFMPTRPPKHLSVVDADLGLMTRNGDVAAHYVSPEKRARWHRQLAYIAAERGYKPGWASHKHKEKFGDWPASRTVVPEPPSPEVRSWVRSRMIAYAKAQQRAAAS